MQNTKKILKKLVALFVVLFIVGALFQIPNEAHAFDPTKPWVCFKNSVPSRIVIDWADGGTKLQMEILNDDISKDANNQTWTLKQLELRVGQDYFTYTNPQYKKALDQLILGAGSEANTGAERGVENYDFGVQVDLPGWGNDINLDFVFNDVTRTDHIFLTRTDKATNAIIKQGISSSNASFDNQGCVRGDSDNTDIYFKTEDGSISVNGYDSLGWDKLQILINLSQLLQTRDPASGEVLSVACKLPNNTTECVKSTTECTSDPKKGAATTCPAPSQKCEIGKGCVNVSQVAPPGTSTGTGTAGTTSITGDVRTVTTKDIKITNPLKFNTPQEIIVNVINYILGFAAFVAIGVIIYGGYQYMTSLGDPTKIEKGKKTLINAIIGLVIIILAFIIVQTVVNIFTSDTQTTPTTPTTPQASPAPGQLPGP